MFTITILSIPLGAAKVPLELYAAYKDLLDPQNLDYVGVRIN